MRQCQKVRKHLETYIENSLKNGESVILEGIHLDIVFMTGMIQKYGNQCLCFLVTIKNSNKHIKRFQARNPELSINPDKN